MKGFLIFCTKQSIYKNICSLVVFIKTCTQARNIEDILHCAVIDGAES
jgi:hypothetical protein